MLFSGDVSVVSGENVAQSLAIVKGKTAKKGGIAPALLSSI